MGKGCWGRCTVWLTQDAAIERDGRFGDGRVREVATCRPALRTQAVSRHGVRTNCGRISEWAVQTVRTEGFPLLFRRCFHHRRRRNASVRLSRPNRRRFRRLIERLGRLEGGQCDYVRLERDPRVVQQIVNLRSLPKSKQSLISSGSNHFRRIGPWIHDEGAFDEVDGRAGDVVEMLRFEG